MEVCDIIDSREQTERYRSSTIARHFARAVGCQLQSPYNYRVCLRMLIVLAPLKVKALMSKILSDSLPTCCNLFRMNLVNSPMCLICEAEPETIEHVFLDCPWTRPLWFGIGFGWTIENKWYPPFNMETWLDQRFGDIRKVYPNAESIIGLMGNIFWAIWKARNEFVLSGKLVNPLEALMIAKAMDMGYFSAGLALYDSFAPPWKVIVTCNVNK